MKQTILFFLVGLVYIGQLNADDRIKRKMPAPAPGGNLPGDKLLYKGGPDFTIDNRPDNIVSGTWPVSPGSCPTGTTAYSATAGTYQISKNTGGFSTGSLTYTATSVGTSYLYERRATYSLDYWFSIN